MLERTLPGRTVERADLPYGLLVLEGDVAEALPVPRVRLLVEGTLHLGDSAVRGESLQNVAVGQAVMIKSDVDHSRRVVPRLIHEYFLVVDEVLFLG